MSRTSVEQPSPARRAALDDIEIFATDADGQRIAEEWPARRTIATTLQAWKATLAAVQENARYLNSPDGFVPGQVDFPTLVGCREDVQVTMHADARVACAAALSDGLLAANIKGLRVDQSTLRTFKTELSWNASLRTSPWRRRDAMLRLSPSPSFQVTVIRLTPVKAQRVATRAFIRAGLKASFELVRRIEDSISRTPHRR